ncbi:MAG: hypothetical protein JMDDDDMK_00381 [Acidobacteria bacterium]|nr:hypothetical protein [Acidobacteriota bacterium]
MGFILKCVTVLLVFSFIVYVLKAIARLSHHLRATISDVKDIREKASGRTVASADMVRCLSCGAFVSSRDAVTISSRNSSRAFCSDECARAHIAK